MASVNDNPELAQEVIRLLHKELSTLRTQLAEAHAQQARGNAQPPPSYADAHMIDALRVQNEELQREKDNMHLELVAVRKRGCTDLEHMRSAGRVEQLVQQLADTSQHKDKLEKLHRKEVLDLEDKCAKLEQKYNTAREGKLSGPQNMTPVVFFDVDAFLRFVYADPVNQPPPQYKGPFSNVLHLRLHKTASDLMKHGSMRYSHSEVIWKAPGLSHFLAIGPMHLFNSKANNGEGCWERALHQRNLAEKLGQQRDILLLHDHTWHYYGTYECVGSVAVPAQKVEKIGSEPLVAYAEKRTILDPESAPENMSKLVHNMYTTGVLRIECFGYRRVGFDEALNAALMQHGAWTRDRKNQDANAAQSQANVAQSQKPQEQKEQKKSDPRARANGGGQRKGGNKQNQGRNQKI